MRKPGFTAEASLYRSALHYRSHPTRADSGNEVRHAGGGLTHRAAETAVIPQVQRFGFLGRAAEMEALGCTLVSEPAPYGVGTWWVWKCPWVSTYRTHWDLPT
jgi:hypothetical protein